MSTQFLEACLLLDSQRFNLFLFLLGDFLYRAVPVISQTILSLPKLFWPLKTIRIMYINREKRQIGGLEMFDVKSLFRSQHVAHVYVIHGLLTCYWI